MCFSSVPGKKLELGWELTDREENAARARIFDCVEEKDGKLCIVSVPAEELQDYTQEELLQIMDVQGIKEETIAYIWEWQEPGMEMFNLTGIDKRQHLLFTNSKVFDFLQYVSFSFLY